MQSGKEQESILIAPLENSHQEHFFVCQKGSQQQSPPEKVQRSVHEQKKPFVTLTLVWR